MMVGKDKLIVALDVSNWEEAEHLVEQLHDCVDIFKIGMQLFYNEGPRIIALIERFGGKVFLDLKLHDIPNTVARACEAITVPGIFMFNVHASAGLEAMVAAARATRERARDLGIAKPLLIGVTVLTSMEQQALAQIGVMKPPQQQVICLAKLVQQAGLDGVVASAQEIQAIRAHCGQEFVIVTPGIRPVGSDSQDQKRVATPGQAALWGANYLVVGRPVTAALNPRAAVQAIYQEMEANGQDE